MDAPRFSVSDFIAVTNQTLEYAYPTVEVEGEVASFKVNQGKFVFFDLKDAGGSVGCFMMLFQLRVPIEDGMKVVVTAAPKLTQWGKFSLTVRAIRPSGEGSLKKSFELLKAKLDAEGLFALERKRPLPSIPRHIAIISSPQAAGYADFIKILNDRWGGMRVDVAAVQVQGADAPDQMIRALNYFSTQEQLPEVIVIIRGGGSADDLSAFNDEQLVRTIAASRVPTLTGIGHEVDLSLSDLAADVYSATPSNAAQIIVPDRRDSIRRVRMQVQSLVPRLLSIVDQTRQGLEGRINSSVTTTERKIDTERERLRQTRRLLAEFDPQRVLERGYALLRGTVVVGQTIEIETLRAIIKAKVENYDER
ncbi:MAG: exodeoxyribonuclease large subunit [Patescibacteria group bacterium]|nr:exodeoxyribonuclease large subunit [Patescibacteria group bacterium]